MAITAVAITARVLSPGRPTSHRPRVAETSSQGPATIAIAANSVPPALQPIAWNHWPRTACDHEVVMPHDGQRTPNNHTNVHGGSPNCRCVPKPLGSGRSQAATPKGASKLRAATASPNLALAVNRFAPW